ncbi:MAG: hypothetical protein R2787_13855 [Saprospiraceae bacterium]
MLWLHATNIENLTTDNMLVSQITIRAAASPFGVYNFKVFIRDGQFQPNMGSNAGWTQVADAGYNVTGAFTTNGGSNVTIRFHRTIYGCSWWNGCLVLCDRQRYDLPDRRIMFNSANTTTNDGNIRIFDGAGIKAGIFTGIRLQPRGAYITVDYQLGGEAEVIQTGGPVSGTELCKDDSPGQ